MFLFLCFLSGWLGIFTEDSTDLILEVQGRVGSFDFADLNGDGLMDLVVMAEKRPGHNEKEEVAPIQIFLQEDARTFCPVSIPEEITRPDFFLATLGNFDPAPGEELLLVTDAVLKMVRFTDQGQPLPVTPETRASPIFQASAHASAELLHMAVDLDGDGFDEVILPTMEGHGVFFCNGDGTFRKPITLDGALEWSIQFSENAFFSIMSMAGKVRPLLIPGQSPLLITEREGKILAYQYQPESRDFLRLESVRSGFSSFDSDTREGTLSYSGIIFTEAEAGRPPLFVLSTREGRSGLLAELKTEHTLFNMSMNQEESSLHFQPAQRIVTDGISAPAVFSDLNGDGMQDLVLIYVKTTILSKLLEMLLERVVITCQVHLYDSALKRFAFEPVWSGEASVPATSFRVIGAEGLIQFNRDYSGDERPDMLVFDSDRLVIKRGEKEEGFFSTQEVAFHSRPFFQIGGPFPGPVISQNIDRDACPEIISAGNNIVRIVYVR